MSLNTKLIHGISMDDQAYVAEYLKESAAAMNAFAADLVSRDVLLRMAGIVIDAMRAGRKLLIAGNGGSAADSQHIAAEFVSRLMFDRAPLPALALTTDSSALTATGNDYGYDHVFERQVLALGCTGDVFLGISTSGRSTSILRAFDAAKARGIVCFGFAGQVDGPMASRCDLLLRAPSTSTAIIQQLHITAAHVFCAVVERTMFPQPAAAGG